MSTANNKYLSYISSTLLGLTFLVSAFTKAWDAEAFADTLLRYGPQWFSIGAPIIILIESVLGTMLLLRLHVRWCAWISDAFLIIVSAIYAYGWLSKGITSCGCFGILSTIYEGKPYITFVRNVLLICISIPALIYYPKKESNTGIKVAAILVISAAACFICGLAMRKSFVLPRLSSVKIDNRSKIMENLETIYPFSKDSTYFVYLFSFTCPHCQNSFANVQQYEQLHVADKVVGIAVENTEAQERFYRIYHPEIEILTISKDKMSQISGQLPIGMLIENNSIERIEGGFITSPGLGIK